MSKSMKRVSKSISLPRELLEKLQEDHKKRRAKFKLGNSYRFSHHIEYLLTLALQIQEER